MTAIDPVFLRLVQPLVQPRRAVSDRSPLPLRRFAPFADRCRVGTPEGRRAPRERRAASDRCNRSSSVRTWNDRSSVRRGAVVALFQSDCRRSSRAAGRHVGTHRSLLGISYALRLRRGQSPRHRIRANTPANVPAGQDRAGFSMSGTMLKFIALLERADSLRRRPLVGQPNRLGAGWDHRALPRRRQVAGDPGASKRGLRRPLPLRRPPRPRPPRKVHSSFRRSSDREEVDEMSEQQRVSCRTIVSAACSTFLVPRKSHARLSGW